MLMHLYAQGALPEMVQVGNENNCGLVHPYGDVCGETSWSDLGELFNSGISAVRDVEAETGSNIDLMLHVAQPENVGYWFDHIINNGDVTDFDIIGISYYTPWSEVPVSQISDSIAEFRKEYNRDVLIVETAYPWTLENADSYGNIFGNNSLVDGYPATEDGQRRFMIDLVQEVKDGGGIGVFYWEPAWITSNMKDLWGTGSSWENNALFDFEGNAHSGFDYMKYDYREE
jgi:arabinogalactan endo-1,4-beta-galactosidase